MCDIEAWSLVVSPKFSFGVVSLAVFLSVLLSEFCLCLSSLITLLSLFCCTAYLYCSKLDRWTNFWKRVISYKVNFMAQILAEVDPNVFDSVEYRLEEYCITCDISFHPIKYRPLFQLMSRNRANGLFFYRKIKAVF